MSQPCDCTCAFMVIMCFFLSQEHRLAEFVPELAEFVLDSTCRMLEAKRRWTEMRTSMRRRGMFVLLGCLICFVHKFAHNTRMFSEPFFPGDDSDFDAFWWFAVRDASQKKMFPPHVGRWDLNVVVCRMHSLFPPFFWALWEAGPKAARS